MAQLDPPAPSPELIILPPLAAQRGKNGGFVLTQKYADGVQEFRRHWPGAITSLVRMSDHQSTDMDHVEFAAGDPDFPIECRPDDDMALAARLKNAALVLAFLSSNEEKLSRLCQKIGVKLAFYTEYSPQTERQIVASETSNLIKRIRRNIWINQATRKRHQMLARADGLQCNGLPSYGSYGHHFDDTFLFFDNRVREEDLVTPAELAAKRATLLQGRPLRLVFGGRLIPMKGAGEVIPIARALADLGVAFSFDIYGAGPLEEAIAQAIGDNNLSDKVSLKGVLNFNTGWVPLLKEKTDLFICPHPQGDPSSTYTEVMSCGVPIAGYANEAFFGLVERTGSGWHVPVGKAKQLAHVISHLNQDRDSISRAAHKGRDFVKDHCFETTFGNRLAHLRKIGGVD